MKQYIKLFEDFTADCELPLWSKPNAPQGAIGHAAVSHSLGKYMDRSQSMTNFSVGDRVRCIDPVSSSCDLEGKIIAFEDAFIRWEVDLSSTGVGINPREYRCKPEQLEKIL